MGKTQYDVIIIGSGLGGLSCAAALASAGYKTLVLEQHKKPGGYATSFTRKGFIFDVSLHSMVVHKRDGKYDLIPGFSGIKDIEFVGHPYLYRAVFPDYDIRIPQKNIHQYIDMLINFFPVEEAGIKALFDDMQGLADDMRRISNPQNKISVHSLKSDFPYLYESLDKNWGEALASRIQNPKLKAIISSLWQYYGLPPSKLSSFAYAFPTATYLQDGGYYPIGRSQTVSDAMVKFITEHGGTVKFKNRVSEIMTHDHTAYGVKTDIGEIYNARVIVSNANPHDTFFNMMNEHEYLKSYLKKIEKCEVSLSCFQIYVGLKKDLIGKLGITDAEIFYYSGYDLESEYDACCGARVDKSSFILSLYDNYYDGYSLKGKNTINIVTPQSYEFWRKYETDYFKGEKRLYRMEKERMADILLERVEKTLLPGIKEAIEVMDVSTPLTNIRFTRNYHGAMYGWNQTLKNSGHHRLPQLTPIKNLYLAGAWTKPGHGYGEVIKSGLRCCAEIKAHIPLV